MICDNLYIYFLSHFLFLNAEILNIPGIKFIINGIIDESPKLNKESLIKWICVFSYIQQKHEI